MAPNSPEQNPEITQPEIQIPAEVYQLVEDQISAQREAFMSDFPDPAEDPEGYEEALLIFEEGIEPFFREDLRQHVEGTYLVLRQLVATHQLSRALCTGVGMNMDIARLVLGEDNIEAFTPGLTPIETEQPYPAVLILDTPPDGFRADILESATAPGGLVVISQDNSIRTHMQNNQTEDPRLQYYQTTPQYKPQLLPVNTTTAQATETIIEVDGVEDMSVNFFLFQKDPSVG